MTKQMKHQGLPSYTLQGYALHPPILLANRNNLQTGSLIVTEGRSDVFQGQPTDSVHLELSDLLQVWLIQHQAAQLAPYDMPVCAGANLAALDTVPSTDCTCNKSHTEHHKQQTLFDFCGTPFMWRIKTVSQLIKFNAIFIQHQKCI
jgi:hypothetical protein